METAIKSIDSMYEESTESHRYHLGASILGHKCDRWLWLTFRHAIKEKFSGRMLRLLDVGHRYENVFLTDLLNIGVDISDCDPKTGEQFRVDLGCHISGSLDGIIAKGLPEAPNESMVAEFKTHSLKSLNYLERVGVTKSKHMHYVQMQIYMHATNLKYAYYLAECKDDCRRYSEIVRYRKATAEKAIARGKKIVLSKDMPERYKYGESSFECQYCPAKPFCHYDDTSIINESCRTCDNVEPLEDSTFYCHKHDDVIPNKHQLLFHECHE